MIGSGRRDHTTLRASRHLVAAGLCAGLSLVGACAPHAPAPLPESSLRPIAPVPHAQDSHSRDSHSRDSHAPAIALTPRSRDLAEYYERQEDQLLAAGKLRTDGGGDDATYSTADLARSFENIAFRDEYHPVAPSSGEGLPEGVLRRWQGPVRIGMEFGPSVPAARRLADTRTVEGYTRRLQRLTGLPMTVSAAASTKAPQSTNFHVLIMGEDDRETLIDRMQVLAPGLDEDALSALRYLSPSVHCLVIGFGSATNPAVYGSAIALIRMENPSLTRRACYNEELAQGLGLRNDEPTARPSIFNDDSEFALLTGMDEKMLGMLYDSRLHAGMTLEQARPVIEILAAEQMSDTPGLTH